MKNNYKALVDVDGRKVPLIGLSVIVGLLAGLVAVLYRMTLTYVEKIVFIIYPKLQNHPVKIILWFLCLTLFGWLIGRLLKRNDMIGGSGIPQVKGLLMGYVKNNWLSTLVTKFLGGTLGILGGLSLGREGPSIQLGACIAEGVSKHTKHTRMEKKILISSGAAAGLAAAFNAPLAGVMFVLEEIFKYFSPLILLSTMAAAICSDFLSKQVFGIQPVFEFPVIESIPLSYYWMLIILGIVVGVMGVVYNYVLLATQRLYKKIPYFSKHTWPIIALWIAGILGIVFPIVLGGGHHIIEHISADTSIRLLLLIVIIKFLLSMVSFASGTPGGIFFPLLVIGGTIGAVVGKVAIYSIGLNSDLFFNFVILGMVGYFAAIVRAPITGIILMLEMTGSFHHLLSLTVVAVVAYVVADVLKSVPIYDSLLENLLENVDLEEDVKEHSKKVIVDAIVQGGSPIVDKCIKDIDLPQKCLLVGIKRLEKEIIPNGDTKILAGDYLIIMTDINSEWHIREALEKLNTYN